MEHELIGRTLGQYEIRALVGIGGMATVYAAHHAALDRIVAVKVLPAAFAHDPELAERFRREARAIAQLQHPNILPVHDFGQQDGITYIVMQYVTGGTLQDRLGARLPLDWCAGICAQVARALDHAHSRGVVHRDVKPGNVLLTDDDWAFLADFGIAKMLSESAGLTRTGLGVGTPAYLSPEQAQGLPVDGRSDIYSLGLMLYEMLAGAVPFRADTPMAVIAMHVNQPVPPLRETRPDVPPEVEKVVLKALAKRPEDRFATAGAFAEALEAATPGAIRPASYTPSGVRTVPNARAAFGTTTSLPAPALQRARQMVRGPVGIAAAAACILLIAAGLAVARPGAATPGPGVSPAPTGGASSAAATATTLRQAAATATVEAEIAAIQAVAAATSEAAVQATVEALAAATTEAASAQQASLEATVQAAVQAAIAALPTPTPVPRPAVAPAVQPVPPTATPPPAVVPDRLPPGGRLVVRITEATCAGGVSGVVLSNGGRPVPGYTLEVKYQAPVGPNRPPVQTKELNPNSSEFHFPVPAAPGVAQLVLVAKRPPLVASEPVETRIRCP